jgi:hypothetical protein
MAEDKTPTQELLWLYRLKQSGFFGPETPQGELLEPSPIHDPHTCEGCRLGPCEWLIRNLHRALNFEYPTKDPRT